MVETPQEDNVIMSNSKGLNPNKRPRPDSDSEDENGVNNEPPSQEPLTTQISPTYTEENTGVEEGDISGTSNDDQAVIVVEIKAKVAQKHANNNEIPNLPIFGDHEYTPVPPGGFPIVHGEGPLWTLNNVTSPQVSTSMEPKWSY